MSLHPGAGWPSAHLIMKSFARCFFLCRSIPPPLPLPEAVNLPQSHLSLLWCLSPQPAVSDRFLFIISLVRAKVILAEANSHFRGDSANSVHRARVSSHPSVCTAAVAHKLPNPTFSCHSGHAPRSRLWAQLSASYSCSPRTSPASG